jgi:hypothetical protein
MRRSSFAAKSINEIFVIRLIFLAIQRQASDKSRDEINFRGV